MPKTDPPIEFRPSKSIMHISIATEQITVQKIPRKLLSKCPQNLDFSLPMPMLCRVSVAHPYHFYIAMPPPGKPYTVVSVQ